MKSRCPFHKYKCLNTPCIVVVYLYFITKYNNNYSSPFYMNTQIRIIQCQAFYGTQQPFVSQCIFITPTQVWMFGMCVSTVCLAALPMAQNMICLCDIFGAGVGGSLVGSEEGNYFLSGKCCVSVKSSPQLISHLSPKPLFGLLLAG